MMMDDRKNLQPDEEEGALKGNGDREPAPAAGEDPNLPLPGNGDR